VRAAKAGELVGPLLQGARCYVFQVVQRRAARFEDVQQELEQEWLERRPSMVEIAAFRNSLRRSAEITLLPALSR